MRVLRKKLQSKYLLLLLFLLMILISYWRVNLKKTSVYIESEDSFELVVADKKYQNDQYVITFKGKEQLISYVNDFPYDVGDIIYVKGSLTKPKSNTIFNTFNYQGYLQSRNILWELKISEMKLIKKNSNLFNRLKRMIANRINNYRNYEYLYVFLVGESYYFNKDMRNKHQACGLSYLISIGSLQVMMIIRLLKIIEGKMKCKKKISLIINIIIIICYIIFTNKIIGVLRSGLCYILSSILKYYKIKYKYQNIIFIVGIILLLINPYYIVNTGFLYSFTISIILSFNLHRIKGNYFRRLFMISLIAFIASLPITIYLNYEINFLAIIYSLLFVPLFHFIIFPLSIIVFMFSFLSPIYSFLISFMEYIISFISKIDILTFVFRKPSMIIIIFYYLVIIGTLYQKKNIIIMLLLIAIHCNINSFINEKVITFLDVGQGDSIIIKNNNHLFLIDTGGNTYYSYSEKIINYIKSLGINKIDAMIISHGEFDHMGGAINLVNNIKVEEVIFNCGSYSELEKELIKILEKKKIQHYSCIKELNMDENKLYFLQTKEYDNENDNSNVIYTELNGYKFMFMGDASTATEKEVLKEYNLSDIDVLKVGHHGSKTSSSIEFINVINPKYSIISVGKNNLYGHPNKEVLDNLSNSKIYRTDLNGSIMFKIKNKNLHIETCSP